MGMAIELETRSGTAWVWLNRPERYNAFDLEMMDLLSRHLVTLAVEDERRWPAGRI